MESDKYSKEMDIAVRVVHMACSLCQMVQKGLVSTGSDQVKSKDDDSPVTVAGMHLHCILSFELCSLEFGVLFFGGCAMNVLHFGISHL